MGIYSRFLIRTGSIWKKNNIIFILSRWDNRQKKESGTNTEKEVQKNTHSETQCSIVYDYFIYKIYYIV